LRFMIIATSAGNTKLKKESCPKCVWWELESGSMDHGLGGLAGFADLICENPSNPPNPWSIPLATQRTLPKKALAWRFRRLAA